MEPSVCFLGCYKQHFERLNGKLQISYPDSQQRLLVRQSCVSANFKDGSSDSCIRLLSLLFAVYVAEALRWGTASFVCWWLKNSHWSRAFTLSQACPCCLLLTERRFGRQLWEFPVTGRERGEKQSRVQTIAERRDWEEGTWWVSILHCLKLNTDSKCISLKCLSSGDAVQIKSQITGFHH